MDKYSWLILAFTALLLFLSLAFFIFPVWNQHVVQIRAHREMTHFSEAIQPKKASEESENRPFLDLWDACVSYNWGLIEDNQENIDEATIQEPHLDLAQYGWEPESFGILSIPQIGVELPLYLGSSADNLLRGAAILGQTSLPIGGSSTNCVICGHRTWNGDDKLRDIEQLQIGDEITIQNPWEELTYAVVDIQVILPSDSDRLLIQPGRDLVSIFTCTPIHVNTHRYLVICQRVDAKTAANK